MSFSHVQDKISANITGTTGHVNITTTAGNVLTAAIQLYVPSGTITVHITGITDSAGNIWTYPSAAVQQSPPANGVFYGAEGTGRGYYAYAAIACCLNTAQPGGVVKAVTSVTVTFSTGGVNAEDGDVTIAEWSGASAATAVLDTAASAQQISQSTTQVTPAVTTGYTSGVVIAQCAEDAGWSAVSSPFSFYTSGSGAQSGAWLITTAAGPQTCTFSETYGNPGAAQAIEVQTILALGASPPPPPSYSGPGTAAGTGRITASGHKNAAVAAGVTGTGRCSPAGIRHSSGTPAPVAATGSMAAVPPKAAAGAAAITATSALTGASPVFPSSAAGTGTVTAAGRKQAFSSPADDILTAVPGAAIPGASVPGDPGPVIHAPVVAGGGVLSAARLHTAAGTASIAGTAAIIPAGHPAAIIPVTVTVAGSAAWAFPLTAGGNIPAPATRSLPVDVATTGGDWLIAILSWHQPPAAPPVTLAVGDDAHNLWDPLGAPSGTSSAEGVTRTAVWYAPAAKEATAVYAAPNGYALSVACTVLDVSGMSPGVSVTGLVTGYGNAGAALGALNLPAPAAAALFITACSSDLTSQLPELTGTGWTPGPPVYAGNGTDTTGDIAQSLAWQVTDGAVAATWSAGAQDLSGITCGVLIAAPPPAQASPMWPATVAEIAPGAGIGTPADEITWVPVTGRYLSLDVTQGRQYELSALSTGEGTVTLDNPDGALQPPGAGVFAGLTSGTPVRLRTYWPGGTWQISWSGNGAQGTPQINSGIILQFTAGQAYTATAWAGASAEWTLGLAIVIYWRNPAGAQISTTTGPDTPVTGNGPVLLAITGTAPAGCTQGNIIILTRGTPPTSVTFYAAAAPAGAGTIVVPPGASWAGENSATATPLAPWTPDPRGVPNITPWNVPFAGFLERLPQSWDSILRGQVTATIVDPWQAANYAPQPILLTEILNDLPYAYWPCIDPPGALQASNYAPGNQNPLQVVLSKYGGGGMTISGSYGFGSNSSGLLGAQGTLTLTASGVFRASSQSGMWGEQAILTPQVGTGYSLLCTDPAFPPISAGVTIEAWFATTSPFPYYNEDTSGSSVFAVMNSKEIIAAVLIENRPGAANPGPLQFVVNSDTSGVVIGGANTAYRQNSGMTHVAVAFNQNSWKAYVNGQLTASGDPGNISLPSRFTTITVNGINGTNQNTLRAPYPQYYFMPYSGYTGHVAVFAGMLTQQRIQTHYQAGAGAMAGEPAAMRIERLLQAGNALGRRVILQESGNNIDLVVSCQDIAGSPASQAIGNLTQSLLPAMFYIAPTGDMFFQAKQASWNQPARWVLGEDIAAGDIVFDWDPTRVINEIQLSQLDDQSITVPSVTAAEAASQLAYGTVSYQATGYLQLDSANQNYSDGPGLMDLANWLAGVYASPRLRLSQVTVDAAAYPGNWPFILGVSPGDMIQVNRVAQNGVSISVTGRVTQTARKFEYGSSVSASVSLIIDPAPEADCLQMDSPALGLLNGESILGW